MAVNIPLSHQTVKAPGQQLAAVADWNANHRITADIDLGAYNLTTTGLITAGNLQVDTININTNRIRASAGLSLHGTADIGMVSFGGPITIRASDVIKLQPSSDADDYIELSTVGHLTTLRFVGQEGRIISDVNPINFLGISNSGDTHLYTGALWVGSGPFINLGSDAYILASAAAGVNVGFTANRDDFGQYASFDWITGHAFNTGWSIQMKPNDTGLYFVNRANTVDLIHLTPGAGVTGIVGVTGVTKLGDGGTTNYAEFSGTGDQVFYGSSGLCFGEIYAHGVAADITSVAINDWDQITAFNVNGLSNNSSPDHTNDHITITKAGKYLVSFYWCGNTAATPHTWDFHVAKNNNAVSFLNITTHVTTAVAGRLTHAGAIGILDLSVNDTIELWVKRLTAGNNIVLTTDNCDITLTQIGG